MLTPGLAQLDKPVAAVGDHTMTHPFLPALSPAAIVQQIAGAKTVIEQAADQPVVLSGRHMKAAPRRSTAKVRALGLFEVLWNVDSADSPRRELRRHRERHGLAGLRPGSIILMHENRGQTIRALPVIFAALARDHLRAVTVPELVAEDPPSLPRLKAGERGCSVSLRSGSGG